MNLNDVYISSGKNVRSTLSNNGITATSMAEKIQTYNDRGQQLRSNREHDPLVAGSGLTENDVVQGSKFGDIPDKRQSVVKTDKKFLTVYVENKTNETFICNVVDMGEVNS